MQIQGRRTIHRHVAVTSGSDVEAVLATTMENGGALCAGHGHGARAR